MQSAENLPIDRCVPSARSLLSAEKRLRITSPTNVLGQHRAETLNSTPRSCVKPSRRRWPLSWALRDEEMGGTNIPSREVKKVRREGGGTTEGRGRLEPG